MKEGVNIEHWMQFASCILPVNSRVTRTNTAIIRAVNALSQLSSREQRVLKLRFGLNPVPDDRQRTLEEVGGDFNVTRERIRQIEAKALRKLRHPLKVRKE